MSIFKINNILRYSGSIDYTVFKVLSEHEDKLGGIYYLVEHISGIDYSRLKIWKDSIMYHRSVIDDDYTVREEMREVIEGE